MCFIIIFFYTCKTCLTLSKSCIDVKTAQGCENSTISLDCHGHERNIQVTDVFYGQRQNSEICALNGTKTVPSKPRPSCRVQGVLPKLQSSCDYRNVCKITIERKTFPHDCTASGALEMFVVYQCNATERKQHNLTCHNFKVGDINFSI